MVTDSPIFAHIASQELAELGRILGRAYVRFSHGQNSQNELDEVPEVEASCVPMKIEPNGTHTCAAHASPSAREMTANERLDHAAETGEPVRCERCDLDEVPTYERPRPVRRATR